MAEFFQWDDKQFKFDIQLIDTEHRQIVHLMNNLYDKHVNQASTEDVGSALTQLYNFTVRHFEDEEKYFDSFSFPEADLHKMIHKQMLSKILEHADNFKKTGALNQDFFNFLKLWLSSHILGIDAKYVQHAKAKKVA